MVKLTLYGLDISPPVRACLLTLKALNLPFEYKRVDLFSNEHMSTDFLKKNPQHTVPMLEDGGNFICDSHAIIAYLVSKYGKDDSFYPKDFVRRALVDQRMYFESSTVYQGALANITKPLFFKKITQIPQYRYDAIIEVYNFLEMFLKDMPYMAGQQLTIADFSIISTVTSLMAFAEIDAGSYPKLCGWMKRMEALPYYREANGIGAQQFVEKVKSMNFQFVA